MLTQEEIRDQFTYRVDGYLLWKPKSGVRSGRVAGAVVTNGYRRVVVNGKTYAVHHLIYIFHTGYNPEAVDHINRDKTDNRIENLRPATKAQNNQNRVRKSKLPKGVSQNASGTYLVRITINGKTKSVGSYDNMELAELVAIEARNKYHKEFANHG